MTMATSIFAHEPGGIDYQPGEVIFREGNAASSMFFVQSGEVDLLVGQQLVETVGVDGFFGEHTLPSGGASRAHLHDTRESPSC